MTSQHHTFLIYLFICILFISVGCSAPNPEPVEMETTEATETATIDDLKAFTKEELATFNGKDGQPAYIAVNGLIYDLTNVASWDNGSHNGIEAGQDITDLLMNESPHGPKVLDQLKPIGTLTE